MIKKKSKCIIKKQKNFKEMHDKKIRDRTMIKKCMIEKMHRVAE